MTNAELIACIQAEEQGKTIQCRRKGATSWETGVHFAGRWNTEECEYRIAREPRKCWVAFVDGRSPHCLDFHNGDNVSELESKGWQLVVEEIR